MRDLKSLRREAGRLRLKAGMPLPQRTLDQLGESALYAILKDARSHLQAEKAEQAFREHLFTLIE